MIAGMFGRRVRGVRLTTLIGLAVLAVLVLVVYVGKAGAWRERTEIARVERQIAQERERVRLLRAEVAYLESPERLERLARRHLGMAPVTAKNEADADRLVEIAGLGPEPAEARP